MQAQEARHPSESLDTSQTEGYFIFKAVQIFYILWNLLNESFKLFCAYLLIYVCKVLIWLFERRLSGTTSLPERQLRHQELCDLVTRADDIFAPFLFIWLILEIIGIVCTYRSYEMYIITGFPLITVANGLNQIWKVVLFVLKAGACSSLNNKVGYQKMLKF